MGEPVPPCPPAPIPPTTLHQNAVSLVFISYPWYFHWWELPVGLLPAVRTLWSLGRMPDSARCFLARLYLPRLFGRFFLKHSFLEDLFSKTSLEDLYFGRSFFQDPFWKTIFFEDPLWRSLHGRPFLEGSFHKPLLKTLFASAICQTLLAAPTPAVTRSLWHQLLPRKHVGTLPPCDTEDTRSQ